MDNEEMRKLLLLTDICRIMIREVEAEDNSNRDLILQIMINLSSDELFQPRLIEFNSIYRICSILYKKLQTNQEKESIKNEIDLFAMEHGLLEEKNKTSDNVKVNFQLEKYQIDSEVNKEIFNNSKNDIFKEIPYYLMILSNLTISEEGQKKFLNVEDEKIKGVVLVKIIDKFFENILAPEFDFCSNLLANSTALKEGRTTLLDLQIFQIFLKCFDKMNNHKVLNTLRLFRNCCFEFETYKDELLINNGILFNLIIKIFILANANSRKDLENIGIEKIDGIYFPDFKIEKANEEREIINDLIVDIFLILTNEPQAVEYMKEKNLLEAFNKMKIRETNDENLKDRIFVICNYLENPDHVALANSK